MIDEQSSSDRSAIMAGHLIGWSKGELCSGLVKGGGLSPITDIFDMFKLNMGDEWMCFAF